MGQYASCFSEAHQLFSVYHQRKTGMAKTLRGEVKAKGADGLTTGERLCRLWKERGGETYGEFAARCGAPENTVKGWLNELSLPGAAHLRGISLGYGVTTDFVLFGVTGEERPAAADFPSLTKGLAPGSIPESLREEYGHFLRAVGFDYGRSASYSDALDAAMRLLTAPLAELRRQRGERRLAPQSLLTDLRNYRGEAVLTRFVFHSLDAVGLALRSQRPAERK